MAEDRVSPADDGLLPELEDWPATPDLPGPADPEPLPVDVLPPALRDYVLSVAGAVQVPPDLPLLLTLGCASAAVAGRVEVDVRPGWREPVGLYLATILPPATRKSPCYAVMTAPLREWEAEAVRLAAPARLAALDVLDVATRRLEAAKAAEAKGKLAELNGVEAERRALEKAREKVPPDGRLLAGDITPEAIVLRMAEQGGRLAILEPEPGPLKMLAGRYSDAQPRLEELKKAWSAEALLVDRVGRPPVRVVRPALTLALMLQPGVLEGLQNGAAFRYEGVLGRVLWCRPPHGLGTRRTGPDVPALDVATGTRYARTVRTLLELRHAGEGNEGSPLPDVLRLDPEATAVLHGWEAEVEAELGAGGRYGRVGDWAGKMVGQSLRVAALLELASRAEDGRPLTGDPIGAWAMRGAVRLLRALGSHALAVLQGLGLDDAVERQRYVLGRARALPAGSSLRDLRRACQGEGIGATAEDLAPVVAALEERGCLRVARLPPGPRGGRPSDVVEVHPALRAKTAVTSPDGAPAVGFGGFGMGSGELDDVPALLANLPPGGGR